MHAHTHAHAHAHTHTHTHTHTHAHTHTHTHTDLTLMHMIKSSPGQSCKEACFKQNMVSREEDRREVKLSQERDEGEWAGRGREGE